LPCLDLRLAQESDSRRWRVELAPETLDRDLAADLAIVTEYHFTHAATADRMSDHVAR
jgi:hypothetical protein